MTKAQKRLVDKFIAMKILADVDIAEGKRPDKLMDAIDQEYNTLINVVGPTVMLDVVRQSSIERAVARNARSSQPRWRV